MLRDFQRPAPSFLPIALSAFLCLLLLFPCFAVDFFFRCLTHCKVERNVQNSFEFFFSLPFLLRKKQATRCANKPYTIWYIIENVWLVSSSSSLNTFFPFRSKLIHRFVLNILNALELNETKLVFFSSPLNVEIHLNEYSPSFSSVSILPSHLFKS